ncbi:MAG TPA: L,D-transpeptidase family protein [Syntrophales bacterium]|nr:L,D-transpeptidase family protein [Syntrophobacterales bacterium]HQL90903.1 L,D-transpeptidase family protein [Syntrophales bacterium]
MTPARPRYRCPLPLLVALVFLFAGSALAQSPPEDLRKSLEKAVRSGTVQKTVCPGATYCNPGAVIRFYQMRKYGPAWTREGAPLPAADTLARAIRAADAEGLQPKDYHLERIEAALGEIRQTLARNERPDAERLVALEFLLTDAYLVYAAHLLNGRVNPETLHADEWTIYPARFNLARHLQKALEGDGFEDSLRRLLPAQPGYGRLKTALVVYRALAERGGWPVVPGDGRLEKGMRSERVPALRARLKVTGELPVQIDGASDLFDEAVEEAVKRFQLRHGLYDDGIVGARTLKALNVPASSRVRQIELNLERWRWLPQNLGNPYILVNIAGYGLEVVENEAPVLTMKIVVGTAFQKTPVFSGKMTYIEMNPYWNVPHSIATEETLEKIRKDPNFFAKENMKVFKAGPNGERVDPAAIDWATLSESNFPYRLRQEPGPRNPLGRIKFMFPNKHSVYLHDTSDPHLFRRERRGFSHGCIRIEKPMDLAEFVMRGSREWSKERIAAVLKTKETTVANLPKPIPVHILYFTAWGNGDGTVHFLEDIYRRDERLDRALQQKAKPARAARP